MRRLHRYICQGWHATTARLMLWLAVAVTAMASFGQVHREANIRERQLCGVVINVHENAKFRASTEHVNLAGTLAYLSDPNSAHDSRALYQRVKENLPVARERVRAADANVVATTVPPVCQKYIGH